MGNRGVLHNAQQEIIRPFKLKQWIYCRLQWKDHHRQIMQPRRYTELFFLDEATALAAGHRPCGFCMHHHLVAFKKYWRAGNQKEGWNLKQIDDYLHAERRKENKPKIKIDGMLPDGVCVYIDEKYLIKRAGNWHEWQFSGYGKQVDLTEARLITPPSILNAMLAGFLAEE